MYFIGMLDSGLVLWWQTLPTKAHFAVALQLDARLIRENNIIERLAGLHTPFTKHQTSKLTQFASRTAWQYFGPLFLQPRFQHTFLKAVKDALTQHSR